MSIAFFFSCSCSRRTAAMRRRGLWRGEMGSRRGPRGRAPSLSRGWLAAPLSGRNDFQSGLRKTFASLLRDSNLSVSALLFLEFLIKFLSLLQICTQCLGSVQNLSKVAVYCTKTSERVLQARCCLNQEGTILGLDLQNCSLKDLGLNFPQAHTAVVIDLQANPLKNDLTNTFRGFTQLQTLVLPPDAICPGGVTAWENVTSFVDSQICQGQKDLCNSTRDPEICPENGSCATDGPGLLQCVCTDGFHGYKCMRQGSFSLLVFFGILGSTTFSISVLLWGTQRRKAKTS